MDIGKKIYFKIYLEEGKELEGSGNGLIKNGEKHGQNCSQRDNFPHQIL